MSDGGTAGPGPSGCAGICRGSSHRAAPPHGGALTPPSAIGCLRRPAQRAGQWAAAPPREAGHGRSPERRRCFHGSRRGGRARPVLCGPGCAPAAAGRRGLRRAVVPLASVFPSAIPEDRCFPLRKNVPAGPGDASPQAEGERRPTAAPAAGRPPARPLPRSREVLSGNPKTQPDRAPAAVACAAPYLRLGEALSAGAARRSRCSGRLWADGGAGPAVTWTPASPPAPARRASSLPAVVRLDANLGLLITRHPAGSAAAAGFPRTSISDSRQPGRHRRVLVCIGCYCFRALPFSGCCARDPAESRCAARAQPRRERSASLQELRGPAGGRAMRAAPRRRTGCLGAQLSLRRQRPAARRRMGTGDAGAGAPRSARLPAPGAVLGEGAAQRLLLRGGRHRRAGGGCGRARGGGWLK